MSNFTDEKNADVTQEPTEDFDSVIEKPSIAKKQNFMSNRFESKSYSFKQFRSFRNGRSGEQADWRFLQ